MNMGMRLRNDLRAAGGLLAPQLPAQGTAFTYQGRLTDHGSPANGDFDFVTARSFPLRF
jgi:hypothetical protein